MLTIQDGVDVRECMINLHSGSTGMVWDENENPVMYHLRRRRVNCARKTLLVVWW